MLGLGVILRALGGNENTVKQIRRATNQKIASVRLIKDGDGALEFTFEDGFKMLLLDRGRSCCESRYMTCDDDLSAFAGATFLHADVEPGSETAEEHGEPHETAFLRVTTDRGIITAETHNEHNGYYGGFSMEAEEVTDGTL